MYFNILKRYTEGEKRQMKSFYKIIKYNSELVIYF